MISIQSITGIIKFDLLFYNNGDLLVVIKDKVYKHANAK